MSYRFKLGEPLSKGIKRIAIEQIGHARQHLDGAGEHTASAVHETRKSLKRLRALARLVRPTLGDKVFRRENGRLRDIGGLLAHTRDLHVMQVTLSKVEQRFGLGPQVCERLRNRLSATPQSGQAEPVAVAREEALQRIDEVHKSFEALPFGDGEGYAPAVEGLASCYRYGRKAFRRAYEKQTDAAFHEWRKTVQWHWRHMQLFSHAWPELIGARVNAAKELSRLLGEDHDLAVLRAFAQAHSLSRLPADEVALVGALCQARQAELRVQIRPKAASLFAESAKELCACVAEYWDAAESLAALSAARDDGQGAEVVALIR
jgi:CHAD domain-containing protein